MNVPRMDKKSTPPGVEVTATTLAHAVTEGRRLTDRDHWIIETLAEHRALTAEQISALDFPGADRARHRVLLLQRRGVLARFRRCVRPGSQPWHYTLGILGETIRAAHTGAQFPKPAKVQEKIVRLSQSRTLDHLIGVNEFFISLIRHSRNSKGASLTEWWSERRAAEICGKTVRPDGYGEWAENGLSVGFFLEYDTGTEQLSDVIDKLDKYAELADAGVIRPVLFVFPNMPRHDNFHALAVRRGRSRVPIATTAADQLGAGSLTPADRVWRPLGQHQRARLIDLGTEPAALPRAA